MWPGVSVVIYLRCQRRGRLRGESERSEMQNNLNKRISGGTQSTTSVLLHLLSVSSSTLLIWFWFFFSLSLCLSMHRIPLCFPVESIVWKSRGAALWVRVETVLITCSTPHLFPLILKSCTSSPLSLYAPRAKKKKKKNVKGKSNLCGEKQNKTS